MKAFHKTLCIFITVISITCTSGCRLTQGYELGDRLIIEAIGIDRTEEGCRLCLQVLDPDSADNSGKTHPIRVLTFDGESVAAAFAKIPAATGKVPLYSQARLLLFGRAAAESGLLAQLDFFQREYNARPDVLFAVSDSAADILAGTDGDPPEADKIEAAIKAGHEAGECVEMPLYRFLNLTYEPSDTAFCTILTSSDDAGKSIPDCRSTALFQNERWTATVGERETKGLLFLLGEVRKTTAAVKLNSGSCTLSVTGCRRTVRVNKAGNSAVFSIRLEVSADLIEYANDASEALDEAVVKKTQEAFEESLYSLLQDAVTTFYHEQKADVCRLLRRVPVSGAEEVSPYKYSVFLTPDETIRLDVHASIRRTGKVRL